ncbi:poly-beta-hydroxybutyrate-responsive repressor [Lysinibacillus sp. KU-BSD001]|uniref:poly-beta-hydroxybutyrate-responsive repressor n=1 Tax=Lysinibacillus sp. KU-BSD001 TaxID=3141328 RepID=UPI0036F2B37E
MKSEESNDKAKNPNIGAPKNFLVPIMLLHLREWNSHGYELMEKLTTFGISSVDQGNFYRLLRQLEKDSLVTSAWDTNSSGPAKRIYSITEAGEQYLDMWAGSLNQYQKLLNNFFNLYNPFYTPSQSLQEKQQTVTASAAKKTTQTTTIPETNATKQNTTVRKRRNTRTARQTKNEQ